jgi:hypothetical protein
MKFDLNSDDFPALLHAENQQLPRFGVALTELSACDAATFAWHAGCITGGMSPANDASH